MANTKTNKEMFPDLYNKTHFKGATTLMTDTREINSFYNDSKLRSRFKVIERGLEKSKGKSFSVEPSSLMKKRFNFADNDSSIQMESRSNLLNDFTNRSRLQSFADDIKGKDSKNQLKSIMKLKKHVYSKSKDLKFDTQSHEEIDDYGEQRSSSMKARKNFEFGVQLKDSNRQDSKKHSLVHVKTQNLATSKTISLDKDLDEFSDSEMQKDVRRSEVDITEITKHVLTQ
mmetsp:Transcript_6497/g.7457  ORF Transcript_6497/g.7457 Transcript_6497/m.7457 type:complete len:229 (-) Transcript_6497:71-757(-)